MRLRERVLLSVAQMSAEGNLAPGEEFQDDRGREQPDPEELRRRVRGGPEPTQPEHVPR